MTHIIQIFIIYDRRDIKIAGSFYDQHRSISHFAAINSRHAEELNCYKFDFFL